MEQKNIWQIAQVHYFIAENYSLITKKTEAIENFLTAIAYFEKSNDEYLEAMAKNRVGSTYFANGDLHEAKKYLQEALDYFMANNFEHKAKYAQLELSNVLTELNENGTNPKAGIPKEPDDM